MESKFSWLMRRRKADVNFRRREDPWALPGEFDVWTYPIGDSGCSFENRLTRFGLSCRTWRWDEETGYWIWYRLGFAAPD